MHTWKMETIHEKKKRGLEKSVFSGITHLG